MKPIIILCIGIALAGCAGSPVRTQLQADANRGKMSQLSIGMTKASVRQIMGEPYKTEAYRISDQKSVEFWLYLTEATTVQDLSVRDRNLTPLAFSDGKLEGWGRNYYEDVLKVRQDINVTSRK